MASGILFEQINFTDCLIQALIIDYSAIYKIKYNNKLIQIHYYKIKSLYQFSFIQTF